MKAIFISRKKDGSCVNQTYPFFLYRKALEKKLDFYFDEIKIDSLPEISNINFNYYDLFIIHGKCLRGNNNDFLDFLKTIKTKKIFLDNEDSTGNINFKVLDYIDVYAKKQVFKNKDLYKKKYYKNRKFVQEFMESYDKNLPVPIEYNLPDSFQTKIFVGWNIGLTEKLYNLVPRRFNKNWFLSKIQRKKLDVVLRCSIKKDCAPDNFWYSQHRLNAIQSLKKLESKFKVISTSEPIEHSLHMKELRTSKICLSPWGFGETTEKDFEAVLSGAMLIKPLMDPIETYPDIYQDKKTCVFVKADFSNLEEVCAYYLSHDEEREKIAAEALRICKKNFGEDDFLDVVKKMLDKVFNSR